VVGGQWSVKTAISGQLTECQMVWIREKPVISPGVCQQALVSSLHPATKHPVFSIQMALDMLYIHIMNLNLQLA